MSEIQPLISIISNTFIGSFFQLGLMQGSGGKYIHS